MTDAPERIWLDWPGCNRGEPVFDEPPERDTQPGQTEYVRADTIAAMRARLAEVDAERDEAPNVANLWQDFRQEYGDLIHAEKTRAEAAETALATARTVIGRALELVPLECAGWHSVARQILALIDNPEQTP